MPGRRRMPRHAERTSAPRSGGPGRTPRNTDRPARVRRRRAHPPTPRPSPTCARSQTPFPHGARQSPSFPFRPVSPCSVPRALRPAALRRLRRRSLPRRSALHRPSYHSSAGFFAVSPVLRSGAAAMPPGLGPDPASDPWRGPRRVARAAGAVSTCAAPDQTASRIPVPAWDPPSAIATLPLDWRGTWSAPTAAPRGRGANPQSRWCATTGSGSCGDAPIQAAIRARCGGVGGPPKWVI